MFCDRSNTRRFLKIKEFFLVIVHNLRMLGWDGGRVRFTIFVPKLHPKYRYAIDKYRIK